MAEQPNRAPITPTPLDVMSTWMFGDPVAGATKRPNLRVKVIGNVPRFVVKTNVPDDKNNGRIDFNCDLGTFSVIMNKIDELAEGGNETYDIEFIDDFIAGKKLDKPVTIATVKVGRDRQSGKVFMAVLGYNRPKIQFFFGPSKFHNIKRGDGSELTAEELSNAYAKGFVKAYAPIVYHLLCSEFNPDAKNVAKAPSQQQGGGQGGGGYQQNRGGGGGNYQQNRGGGNSGGGAGDFGDVEGFGDW